MIKAKSQQGHGKSVTDCTDSPYLLMEVRDMLADEGMLYDEVCLGTKATTQRSDTCEETRVA